MKVTKEEFYRERALSYNLENPEEVIRYVRALRWVRCKPGLVVRDIGCKFGVLKTVLSREIPSLDYQGIDIDQATLERIPDYDPELFYCYNVNKGLPFADESVDYIFCLEVLEHLENPSYLLEEVHRTLQKSGKLILSVPNPYCWMECWGNSRRLPDREGHIGSYTFQNINALLRFSNLKLYGQQGTYTRIPLTRRLFGHYKLLQTDSMFLTRSYMFLIGK